MKWDVVEECLSYANCTTLTVTGVKIADPDTKVMEKVDELDGNYMVLARKKRDLGRENTANGAGENPEGGCRMSF